MSRPTILTVAGLIVAVGLTLVLVLGGSQGQQNGASDAGRPESESPSEIPEVPSEQEEPVPKPGRYLLLLTMDQGLLGVLDEQQVFRGEQLYAIGTMYSGAPILKRYHVKEIIWPDGVDPEKYPAKKE